MFSDFYIGMDIFLTTFMTAILVWTQNLYSSCQEYGMIENVTEACPL